MKQYILKQSKSTERKLLAIGLVIDDSLDKPDGVQQYVKTLGAWLTGQGHEVHYLTSATKDIGIDNVHSLSKKIKTRFNGNSGGTPLPGNTRLISRLLKKTNFDILHIQMPYSPFLAGRIINRASKNTAVVGTFHIFPETKLVHYATHVLGAWVRRQLKRFDAMISVSSAAQKFMKSSYKVDSQIIPNMIDVPRFLTPLKSSANSKVEIVFLGRLVGRKGGMQLLQAIKYMADHNLAHEVFHVTIGGKGVLRTELEQFVRASALEERVAFTGFVAESDKVEFLHKADIAVFPSLGGESFGISLLEAMAASRGTVIAGDNPGYRTVMDSMEDQLINPQNTKEFAYLIAKHVNNPDLRMSARRAQREHVQQYDTPIVGEKILTVYASALQDRE